MSLTADVIRLVVGMLVGMVLPRLPLLFFTRFLSMERELPPSSRSGANLSPTDSASTAHETGSPDVLDYRPPSSRVGTVDLAKLTRTIRAWYGGRRFLVRHYASGARGH